MLSGEKGEEPLLEICELVDRGKATKKNILKLKNLNYNKMRPFINLNDAVSYTHLTLPTIYSV